MHNHEFPKLYSSAIFIKIMIFRRPFPWAEHIAGMKEAEYLAFTC